MRFEEIVLPETSAAPQQCSHLADLFDVGSSVVLQLQEVVQSLLRGFARHDKLAEPSGETVLDSHHRVASLRQGNRGQDIRKLSPSLEAGCAHQLARFLSVHEGVADAGVRNFGKVGPSRNAQGDEDGLLHKVHTPDQTVALPHWTSSHSSIHLDQLRACGAGVLAFDVEDARSEAQGFAAIHGEILQLCLLLLREHRRAESPSLVEVGLQSGAIVRDSGVPPVPLGHDNVHINFWTVQVLFQENSQVHHRFGIHTLGAVGGFRQSSAGNHEAPELLGHLEIS
mmetsp:Transcript_3738/g.8690  ORF Transcript_3738/g.8690 Transcript_3738/m.8690 type:complete len:283 (-) Transcript_3738:1070-1918(-)